MLRRHPGRLARVAIALALVAVACGGAESESDGPAQPADGSGGPAGSARAGCEAIENVLERWYFHRSQEADMWRYDAVTEFEAAGIAEIEDDVAALRAADRKPAKVRAVRPIVRWCVSSGFMTQPEYVP